jgi:hypothetical protein
VLVATLGFAVRRGLLLVGTGVWLGETALVVDLLDLRGDTSDSR